MEGTPWRTGILKAQYERREELKQRYLKMVEKLIDLAFDGKPQPFMFCNDENDEPIILEMYEEYDELHWRVYGRTGSESSGQDGSD